MIEVGDLYVFLLEMGKVIKVKPVVMKVKPSLFESRENKKEKKKV